ncbi:phosphoribosyltransferase family protein [Clostridium sp.]|jgi:adenine/guanine phosphoribosyltransferase-like PRPP-binding protein|uniref:phosphoribosyltransferase family protein n=1 Tax=Clostridium sp. TaxID=1506 RepID=UPI0039F4DF93
MKERLRVLDEIAVDVEINKNPFDFKLKNLFLMAARKNAKRAFLFVSKVLGKHIPVNPKQSILTGRLLGFLAAEKVQGRFSNFHIIVQAIKDDKFADEALEYAKANLISLDKPTLFIGFAETATALGNSVFAQFKGDNVFYIHTTREELIECTSAFDFEEEHSHATSHFCYPLQEDILNNYERIVLVDDEITTGKTALNLIKAINNKYPNKEYVVVSILDWRRKEHIKEYKALERELKIKIHEVSLIDGEAECHSPSVKGIEIVYQNQNNTNKSINIQEEFYTDGLKLGKLGDGSQILKLRDGSQILRDKSEVLVKNHSFTWDGYRSFTKRLCSGELKKYSYINSSGRFGISSGEINKIEAYAEKIVRAMEPFSEKVIILGTEEFMYIPMVIASKIPNAKYQSTTRSPIYAKNEKDYGIQCASRFRSPFDKEVINYVYNIKKDMYEEVLFITERKLDDESKEEMINLFVSVGIYRINFVHF